MVLKLEQKDYRQLDKLIQDRFCPKKTTKQDKKFIKKKVLKRKNTKKKNNFLKLSKMRLSRFSISSTNLKIKAVKNKRKTLKDKSDPKQYYFKILHQNPSFEKGLN